MLPINAFSIENFKSFGPKQRFPLKRVNFLFGPNSEGKSSSLLALGILMKGLLRTKFDFNSIKHIDNSPEIALGMQLLNRESEKDYFLLEQEKIKEIENSKHTDVSTLIIKNRFYLHDLHDKFYKKFQAVEVHHDTEHLILEIDEETLRFNLNSHFLQSELLEYTKRKFNPEWDGIVEIDNMMNFLDEDFQVQALIYEDDKKEIRNAYQAIGEIVKNLKNALLSPISYNDQGYITHSSLLNPFVWVGPNRMVTDKTCIIGDEKDFIESSFLNSDAVEDMAQWLSRNDSIKLDYKLELKEVKLENTIVKEFGIRESEGGNLLKLSEVGSGVSHIFQMLLPFFNNVNSIIIQQPEIHLHPSLQVQLCRTLIKLSKEKNVQLIFETHSEHFIKAAQLEIAKSLNHDNPVLTNEDLSVLYVSKGDDGFSKVKKMGVDETGSFTEPWPDDFFELSADLSLERLRQSFKSKN